ncbi:MAG: ion channel [Planctomycetota bacterium]
MSRLGRLIRRLGDLHHPEEREVVFPVLLGVWVALWFATPVVRGLQAALYDRPDARLDLYLFELGESAVSLVLTWLLYLSIWAWSRKPRMTRVALVLALVVTAGVLVNLLFLPAGATLEVALLPILPLAVMACGVLLVSLLRAERASRATLCGAVLCYMLIGMVFSHAYACAWILDPDGALVGLPPLAPGQGLDDYAGRHQLMDQLHYFSYVTLTTLGYGDVHPASPATRLLSVTEALLGQIYLAVVIAKLVSLYLVPGTPRSDGGPGR